MRGLCLPETRCIMEKTELGGKDMKKLLGLLLAVVCCCATICAGAEEPAVHASGDWGYVLLEDGTAEIVQYTGSAALAGLTLSANVTSIGPDAFSFFPPIPLTVPEGSYAQRYAEENNIPYTYADSTDWLLN